jgi:beta-glucosidase/6-phospho-beta-glucosidase/beta-galactosidase
MQLVTQLGCNSFRFSFEWARIEPAPGQIDASAIQR